MQPSSNRNSQYLSSAESTSSAYFDSKVCMKYENGNSEILTDATVCFFKFYEKIKIFKKLTDLKNS